MRVQHSALAISCAMRPQKWRNPNILIVWNGNARCKGRHPLRGLTLSQCTYVGAVHLTHSFGLLCNASMRSKCKLPMMILIMWNTTKIKLFEQRNGMRFCFVHRISQMSLNVTHRFWRSSRSVQAGQIKKHNKPCPPISERGIKTTWILNSCSYTQNCINRFWPQD